MYKKKILIIGGTGFIGHHLVKACIQKKWRVTSVSLTKPSKEKFVKKVKYILCDISKIKQINKKLKGSYNYIVNLGGHVDHNNKIKTYSSHYRGLKNLIHYF